MKSFVCVILALGLLQLASAGYNRRARIVEGGIDSACEYDDDCIVPNTFCKNNRMRRVCACKNKYAYDSNEDACFPTELSLKCRDDDDCTLPNSYCSQSRCGCRQGFVSQNNAGCLTVSRLSESCESDEQCVGNDMNSKCDTQLKTCTCKASYHVNLSTRKCSPNKRIGDQCDTTESCANTEDQTDKVECRRDRSGPSKCQCRDGFSQNNNDFINICAKGLPDGASSIVVSSVALLVGFVAAYFS